MTSSEISPSTQEQIETCIAGADVLFKSGDHDGAFEILQELRKMFPDSSEVLYALIFHYSQAGNLEALNENYQELLLLGRKLQGSGSIEDAIKAYKTANRVSPSIMAYANLAFLRTLKARQILAAS